MLPWPAGEALAGASEPAPRRPRGRRPRSCPMSGTSASSPPTGAGLAMRPVSESKTVSSSSIGSTGLVYANVIESLNALSAGGLSSDQVGGSFADHDRGGVGVAAHDV